MAEQAYPQDLVTALLTFFQHSLSDQIFKHILKKKKTLSMGFKQLWL
jgi:hypothetical protein